jgi:hypothetical protein
LQGLLDGNNLAKMTEEVFALLHDGDVPVTASSEMNPLYLVPTK